MTRFETMISGKLGENWKKRAEEEVRAARADIDSGAIRVDERGILRNLIGRVASSEVAELCSYIGFTYDVAATIEERYKEYREAVSEYCKACEGKEPSTEERAELKAAFGSGARVVNVITGKTITTQ